MILPSHPLVSAFASTEEGVTITICVRKHPVVTLQSPTMKELELALFMVSMAVIYALHQDE